jgi:hypothetical protein
MNKRTSAAVTAHAVMERMIETAHPRDSWEARSSVLVVHQRDPSSAAGLIDYALSYGNVHMKDICMTGSFIVKRWRKDLL